MSTSRASLSTLAVLAVLVVICTATICTQESCFQKQVPEWDYLLFVVQWPESFCLYYNDEQNSQLCVIPTGIHNWTIHGTWPTRNKTTLPTNCNSSWPFDESKITDIKDELEQYWPDLLSGPSDALWSHEWDKHGTCAASLPALYGEHNYFSGTIKLRLTFNMDKILEASGIVPSPTASYTLDAIAQAVQKATGAVAHLVCFQKTVGSVLQQDLEEVRLCIDKTLKPFDCPDTTYVKPLQKGVYLSPCSPKTRINLPPIVHKLL